ncbi:site-specific integrase [Pelomonas sp. V22]|uniref:tyrosine-type recombinase/integrase n=1 Tax=Pelomonas sp. V22 TaxID=2822139 RepID=UPI0024A99EFD|nr:tyrosine-type recombinase/integrase [Pelomonas sp. V22]MDI4635844.1 site-specific integrase [Pelomonas sp. V22]
MTNLDLFDTPIQSNPSSFDEAWTQWLDGERRAGRLQLDSSVAVYESMWSALTAWCVGNDIAVDNISVLDLDLFLNSRGGNDDISARHAWRFLRLVDRVLAARARLHGSRPNLSAAQLLEQRPELRYANAAEKDPLPTFLPAGEAKRLVTYLSAVRPGRSSAGQSWQEVRNRASVALMLGAGVTPGEIRALEVADAIAEGGRAKGVPWKLRVRGHADAAARETPIAPWAGQLVGYWLAVRAEQGIPGQALFPSTRTGKVWSKVSQYNATKEVLQAAGVDDVDGGSYRLRHTFALRQLRRGKAPGEVASWLGVTDPAVMARYQRVLPAPVDVV